MTPGLFTESKELEYCVPYAAVMRKQSVSRPSYSVTRCTAVFRIADQSSPDCQGCKQERQVTKINIVLTVQV